jgi:CIC family chloride channel protein
MEAFFSTRRLLPLERMKRSIENLRYLLKWFLMSALIGIVAGVGAIAFYAAIHLANHWFLNGLVGYVPPDPVVRANHSMRAI